MQKTNVHNMSGQPIHPPAQVSVTNRKAPINSWFVACHSLTLKRTQANPLQKTSFGLRSFGSSGLTAWNDMPAHLCNLDLSLSDQTIAENRFVPYCSGVVTVCAFVTANLLTKHFEMSVYYYIILLLFRQMAEPGFELQSFRCPSK